LLLNSIFSRFRDIGL